METVILLHLPNVPSDHKFRIRLLLRDDGIPPPGAEGLDLRPDLVLFQRMNPEAVVEQAAITHPRRPEFPRPPHQHDEADGWESSDAGGLVIGRHQKLAEDVDSRNYFFMWPA